jgi:hypothetical protein
MRVVLDTNVLVSAALKQQSSPGMAVLLVERNHVLLKSPATEGQLFAVVACPSQSRFTGESRCPRRKWIPAFAGKARRGRQLNHLNGSEQ